MIHKTFSIYINKGQEANKGLFNLVYGENFPSILLLYSFCEHFTDLSAGGEVKQTNKHRQSNFLNVFNSQLFATNHHDISYYLD